MDLLGEGGFHVLDHAIVVCLAEQVGQKETRDVDAFVGIGIAIVGGDAFGHGPEYFAAEMGEEACLLVVHFQAADLGKEFFGENILYVALFLRFDGPRVGVLAEPGECLFACVNGARLENRLGHDGIVYFFLACGSQDEFVDIAIGQNAECSKENHDGNVGLDARKGSTNHGNELILGMVDDLDGIRFGNLVVIGTNALDLDDFQLFRRGAAVAEDKGAIL